MVFLRGLMSTVLAFLGRQGFGGKSRIGVRGAVLRARREARSHVGPVWVVCPKYRAVGCGLLSGLISGDGVERLADEAQRGPLARHHRRGDRDCDGEAKVLAGAASVGAGEPVSVADFSGAAGGDERGDRSVKLVGCADEPDFEVIDHAAWRPFVAVIAQTA